MTSRQRKLEFEAFVRKMAPKERTVGVGKPGRRFRRVYTPSLDMSVKAFARLSDEGCEWLARKDGLA